MEMFLLQIIGICSLGVLIFIAWMVFDISSHTMLLGIKAGLDDPRLKKIMQKMGRKTDD